MSGVSSLLAFVLLAAFGLYILNCNPVFLGGKVGVSGGNFQTANININRASIQVRHAAASSMVESSPAQRPRCMNWYKAAKGDTQWSIAERFASQSDKNQWIESMRWVSRKVIGDDSLKEGEQLCVNWVRTTLKEI